MQESDLAFFTTRELVDELLRRRTFLGVVVHAEDDHRREWTGEKVFRVRYNANLEQEQVGRLLDVVAEHVDRQGG